MLLRPSLRLAPIATKVRDSLRLDPCLQDLGRPVHVSLFYSYPPSVQVF